MKKQKARKLAKTLQKAAHIASIIGGAAIAGNKLHELNRERLAWKRKDARAKRMRKTGLKPGATYYV